MPLGRAASGAVELHVADSGPGLPPGFLGRAFERFSRADRPGPGGGAGLGLSIVRMVAEAHGGSAHVRESSRGRRGRVDRAAAVRRAARLTRRRPANKSYKEDENS